MPILENIATRMQQAQEKTGLSQRAIAAITGAKLIQVQRAGKGESIPESALQTLDSWLSQVESGVVFVDPSNDQVNALTTMFTRQLHQTAQRRMNTLAGEFAGHFEIEVAVKWKTKPEEPCEARR
jgi:transcriptional regulator with XRE-family HTH domain